MGPVRIAVQVHPQHIDYAGIRDAVIQAEEMGVDVIYNWDHFYPLYGWFEKDYTEYEYEFGTAISRLRDLDAAMPRITSRLERLDPPPIRHIPILIGGGGEKVTLRIVAEHADIWHTFGGIETITHKSRVLDEWCSEVDRDPTTIKRSVGVKAHKLDAADAYAEIGVTEFTLGFTGPEIDLSPVTAWLEWRDSVNGT